MKARFKRIRKIQAWLQRKYHTGKRQCRIKTFLVISLNRPIDPSAVLCAVVESVCQIPWILHARKSRIGLRVKRTWSSALRAGDDSLLQVCVEVDMGKRRSPDDRREDISNLAVRVRNKLQECTHSVRILMVMH